MMAVIDQHHFEFPANTQQLPFAWASQPPPQYHQLPVQHSQNLPLRQLPPNPISAWPNYPQAQGQYPPPPSSFVSAKTQPYQSPALRRVHPIARQSYGQPPRQPVAAAPNTPLSLSLHKRMPSRSIKRPADSQTDIGVQPPAKVKLPKLERGHDDEFSQIVKGRFQSYTRTGQACDRCKVRKIRCDADPLGCSQCKQQNHPCTSINRVTGRPERRGYTQELEREKAERDAYIENLERILIDKGIEVKQKDSPYPPGTIVDEGGSITQDTRPFWAEVDNVWIKELPNTSSFAPSFPRNLLESRPEDSHLGLGGDNAPFSSLKGTRLSILGMTIDVGSLEEPDSDEPPDGSMEPIYNKSTQAFLRSSMGVNPPLEVALPERQVAFNYSEMYFRTLYNFLPTLHRPTFMKLLERIYDEPEFKPSVAELVIVHMLFATIFFQYGVRNWQDAEQRTNFNEMSNRHYHFSLSKLYELRIAQDLTSLQAIAMIAAHTRAFPKPGAASLISNIALHRALEMNLHRESRKRGEATNLEHEMRKRVWWAILTVYIAVTGRLGRPMPIPVEEFDVGYPEAIADEFLTEEGVNTQEVKPCPYEIGIVGFKVIPIFMEMYSNIYCVRRDARSYVTVVNALDAQIRDWEDALPESLKLSQADPESPTILNALYAKAFYLEFRLCLRHPSATMGNNKEMMADNTRICEEVGREMLGIQQKIQELKSLDTTWYQISVHTAAIFSMLAASWERRQNITAADIAQLRKEMNGWISILEEIGNLIGSGPRISTEIDRIIRNTIERIETDMHGKSSKGVATDPALKQDGSPPDYAFPTTTLLNGASQAEAPNTGFFHDPSIQYPQLGYGNQGQNNIPPQNYNDPLFYQTQNAAQAAMTATTAQQTNPMMTYSSHVPQVAPGDMWPRANANNAWYNWSNAMSDTSQATSALMTLRDEPVQELAQVTSAGAMSGVLSWPETTYAAHHGNMNG